MGTIMNWKRMLLSVIGVVGGAILLSGCSTFEADTVKYTPEPGLVTGKAPISSLLVRIRNERPEEETLPFEPNSDPWILLPLCFYSSQRVNPMVNRNYLQNTLDEALLRVFVKNLTASGLCGEVFICGGGGKFGSARAQDAYRLDLALKHAVWHRSITAYGLSYPGTFLWVLGAPVSYGDVTLEMEASLYEPGKTIKPLATRKFTIKESCVEWIYEQIGYHPAKSETILTEVVPELASSVREFVKEAVGTVKSSK